MSLGEGITTHIARFYGQGSGWESVTSFMTGRSLSTSPRNCLGDTVGTNNCHEFVTRGRRRYSEYQKPVGAGHNMALAGSQDDTYLPSDQIKLCVWKGIRSGKDHNLLLLNVRF